MTATINSFGQPVGPPVPDWTPRARPPRTPTTGRYCTVEPLDADRHGPGLYEEFRSAPDGRNWTYLAASPPALAEPPGTLDTYLAALKLAQDAPDAVPYAICVGGRPLGVASYLRIDPANGSIEVGSIHFGLHLARTVAATEAMFLMMAGAFDELGYRRYEWKCDSRNAPSRAAALRLGFTFEGIFRNAMVYKGRSRDTAWYSITDDEWPGLRAGFEAWLDPANFQADGEQRASLAALRPSPNLTSGTNVGKRAW